MKLAVALGLAGALIFSPAIGKPKHYPPLPPPRPNFILPPLIQAINELLHPSAANNTSPLTNPITTLQAFTVADIQAALLDAGAIVVNNGGGGYSIGDVFTLANGITGSVGTIGSTGNIITVANTSAGLFSTNAPVVPVISTSGKGSGALFMQNDTTAATCYTALIPLVQQTLVNPLPGGLGLFQAFQKARDAINNVTNAEAQLTGGPLNTACAPLVLSAQNTIIMLGAAVGVKLQ